jgi:hypothetical protein
MFDSIPTFCCPMHVKIYAAFGETVLLVDYATALLTLSFDGRA